MKINHYFFRYFLVIMFCTVILSGQTSAAEESGEILITSIGQSADARMISVLATRYEIEAVYNQIAAPEIVKDFKIVIAVVGGSSKGLGAAGIDKDQEIARTKELIKEIKAQNVKFLVMHVGGEGRRGALSDAFLDETVPNADHLIVVKAGDMDGYFTKISKEKGIPIEIVEKIVDTGPLVKTFIEEQLALTQ